jgi:hypothetical protein
MGQPRADRRHWIPRINPNSAFPIPHL